MALKDLVKRLDRVFSEYVRLNAADDNGYCTCITCGKVYHYKEIHNGHFIPRARMATRFNEMNCNPQCVRCNHFRHGEPDIYRQRLVEMYGKEAVEALELEARINIGYDVMSLDLLSKDYRAKVKELKKEKAIC
jgi:hypothetical protein